MPLSPKSYDAIIIGAGAAGMMCAAHAGKTGKSVLLIDHNKAPGEKIRISGGGRCNFTNLNTTPQNFLSQNPHFAKSALARYSQHDFLALVQSHKIAFHEKTKGQLFCDESAKAIITMLLAEMEKSSATLWLETKIADVNHDSDGFLLSVERSGKRIMLVTPNLVIATGGKSIPKMGASGFGYEIAKKFGHGLRDTRPALVPLTFSKEALATISPLSGVSTKVAVSCNQVTFEEDLLFTHRGLSGPAILQISSHWREGAILSVNFFPSGELYHFLKQEKQAHGARSLTKTLSSHFPNRLLAFLLSEKTQKRRLADMPDRDLNILAEKLHDFSIRPVGSEGYRTAEVTLGGVETKALNSKTMESEKRPGLYFIGEVVDVTGWLGGYNFQWAWSSGWAAGTAISAR